MAIWLCRTGSHRRGGKSSQIGPTYNRPMPTLRLLRRRAPNKKIGHGSDQDSPRICHFFIQGGSAMGRWGTRNDNPCWRHCEPSVRTRGAVIASVAKQSRTAKRTSDRDCFVAALLAMTTHGGVIASPRVRAPRGPRTGSAKQSPYRSSYRSRHSGLDPLIRSIFFCREPALICFSRAIAPDASYPAS
jgi:hypothetical protein